MIERLRGPTGRWLNRQVISASSGTYTPTPGTRGALVQGCGAGGGGGGAGSGGLSAGAGGASGVYFEKWIQAAAGAFLTGGAFVCGAAGSGGLSTAPWTGGTGGDSTIVINGVTYTAKGGPGGQGGAGNTSGGNNRGGAPATGSSAGDIVAADNGAVGVWVATTVGWQGPGGSGAMGAGGRGAVSGVGAGLVGFGWGAGGGGAEADPTAAAGGAGTQGGWIVDEFS